MSRPVGFARCSPKIGLVRLRTSLEVLLISWMREYDSMPNKLYYQASVHATLTVGANHLFVNV
jgi:hypothetical protein